MKKKLSIIIGIIFFTNLLFANGQKVRLKEITRIKGVRSNQLIGMGLVIGLAGTGDNSDLTPQMLQNLYEYFGTSLARDQIESGNVAAVMLTATLPPFTNVGDTIDVRVSSVNDAQSLEGGVLLMTPLRGGQGADIYGYAQGSLTSVNNETANTVNGLIPNGAIVEKEVPIKIEEGEKISLLLNSPDFTTASRIADVLNKRFGYETAKATNPSTVEINKTFAFNDNVIGFVSAIENLEVEPDRESVIVINERTGTIILGDNIRVSPVAISHNDLSISISAQLDTEKAFDEGNSDEEGESFYFEGTSVKNVVKMLNAVGAEADDIISIIEALKEANAIDASIKIM
ncbi:MAG: flagellar basal body P-ring protein FlgI [Fusobacteriota bacterium]